MKTIRVTGRGQIKVKPDLTRIRITLEDTHASYEETLCRSSERSQALRTLLQFFDFAPSDLKTLNFQVNTEYESYQEDGVYKQRFRGYTYMHEMKIEFPIDNERLGRILFALSESEIKPVFQISYTVSNPEDAKNTVLAQAVSDAAKKARVLADAAGVSLGTIQSIDYSWDQVNLEVRPMMKMMAVGENSTADRAFALDIELEDINLTDVVTVVWEIAQDD